MSKQATGLWKGNPIALRMGLLCNTEGPLMLHPWACVICWKKFLEDLAFKKCYDNEIWQRNNASELAAWKLLLHRFADSFSMSHRSPLPMWKWCWWRHQLVSQAMEAFPSKGPFRISAFFKTLKHFQSKCWHGWSHLLTSGNGLTIKHPRAVWECRRFIFRK